MPVKNKSILWNIGSVKLPVIEKKSERPGQIKLIAYPFLLFREV